MGAAEFYLPDHAATEALGERLAGCCRQGGLLLFLKGELGAGKTTLVRGFLHALGHGGAVKSPTYTLVESYPLDTLTIHHLDLYRLADAEELEWLGMRDLLAEDAICLIEWPERGSAMLPPPDLQLQLNYKNNGRQLRLEANGEVGDKLLSCLGI